MNTTTEEIKAGKQTAATVITYREAVRGAMNKALRDDSRVFLMGEDVGKYGGCFAASKGMLDEFGPERIIDTPLSESGFTGIGIGAAIAGMRPIVEIMTVNFCLLAMDQIVNNAATLLHMSGGQVNVPIVIRMATGGGKQLAAQHSHSLEGWIAHIPGLKVLTPATIEDASGMLQQALDDPDPVLIFENSTLYNMEGNFIPEKFNPDVYKAMIRVRGNDISLITYGASLYKALEAAEELKKDAIECEVIDLRSLRPLDTETIIRSVSKTGKVVVIDEGWKSGSISAEIITCINENAFYKLDAPPARVCTEEVPLPYAGHLEDAALPNKKRIIETVKKIMQA